MKNYVYAFFCNSEDEDGKVGLKLCKIETELDAKDLTTELIYFLGQTDGAYVDDKGYVHEVYNGKDQVYCKYFDEISIDALKELRSDMEEFGLKDEADYLTAIIDYPLSLEYCITYEAYED